MATLLLSVLGAFAEFERTLIRERQAEGIALVKARGAYKGRKKSLTTGHVEALCARAAAGDPKPAWLASSASAARPSMSTCAGQHRHPQRGQDEPLAGAMLTLPTLATDGSCVSSGPLRATRGVLRRFLADSPLRCHGVKETVLDSHRCRHQPGNPDTAVASAPRAATPSTVNGAAITNVPDWLVQLAIRLVPSALVCVLTVLVVLGLVANGYFPR
jgi:hypothetical protein